MTTPTAAPATLANESVYRRLLEVIAAERYDEIADLFHSDAVLHTLPHPVPAGIEEMNRPLFVAFPDLAVEVVELVATDTHVAATLRWSGTHQAPLFGVGPTGRAIAVTEIEIVRVEDGRIAELWNVVGLAELWEQLGVAPPG